MKDLSPLWALVKWGTIGWVITTDVFCGILMIIVSFVLYDTVRMVIKDFFKF